MPYGELSAVETARRRTAPGSENVILLDCREDEEVALARIEGALHIPMGEVARRLHELDRAKSYIVCCHHGVRSAHVARFLMSNGFPDVMNLRGGIDAWSREVDPQVPRY